MDNAPAIGKLENILFLSVIPRLVRISFDWHRHDRFGCVCRLIYAMCKCSSCQVHHVFSMVEHWPSYPLFIFSKWLVMTSLRNVVPSLLPIFIAGHLPSLKEQDSSPSSPARSGP